MSVLERIETKFIFKMTRFIALFFITVATLFIIAAVGVTINEAQEETISISTEEIESLTKPALSTHSNNTTSAEEELPAASALGAQPLPFAVEKHVANPRNRRIINSWLETLDPADRPAFLDELEALITRSEARNSSVDQDLNKLWELKVYKLKLRQNDKISEADFAAYGSVLAGSAITIALFSCVLILLRIETNTRLIK